jgi:YVTN family beta-propeller protein
MEVFPDRNKTNFSGNGRKKKILLFSMCGVFLFSVITFFISKTVFAASAPSIITYQGKLLVSNSLATTTQSMYFVLYDASSGGSVLYTASGTVGVPQPLSITPSQGLFSVNLGDTGTNPIDPSVFQNNASVYLEVRVGSDTLTPRKRITSVPYAFNARYLDGVGVNTVSTSVYIPKSDANGNFTFNSTTITTSTITNLTVLGGASLSTINAGTWNGSVIGTVYGGTGQDSSAWTGLIRVTAGTWSTTTVALTTDVTGVLPIANGGTNSSTLAANGSLIYSDGTRYNAVAVGNSGYVLQSTGSGAPVWVATSSLGFAASYTNWTLATSTDDIGYSVTSGVKAIFAGINGVTSTRSGATLSVGLENSGVTAGTYGSASAVPVLTIDAYGRVTTNATSSIAINGNQITSGVVSNIFGGTGQDSSAWTGLIRVTAGTWSTTTVALTTDVTGVLPIANGGTNSSTLAANGSLIYSDGTRYNAVAVGNSGYVLQSTGSGAPVWVATSSLGFAASYTNWTLATSTDDIGYSVTSGVKAIFAGINGVTSTRSGATLSVGLENSGVTAGTYGSASAVPVLTIDAYGRVTTNATSSIAINGNQITSGVVSNIFGGTGQDSSAWTGLIRVTAGTWSTTTVALTTDVTGVLPIANGGTNSSTLAANGSLIYSDGTRYNAVAVGNSGYVLQSTGSGAPVWVATSSLGFVNLQGSSPGTQQIGNFNLSGTGIIGTSFGVGTSTVSSSLVVQAIAGVHPLNIVSSSGSSLFVIRANGVAGINVDSPQAKFDVRDLTPTTTGAIFQIANAAGTIPYMFVSSTATTIRGASGAVNFELGVSTDNGSTIYIHGDNATLSSDSNKALVVNGRGNLYLQSGGANRMLINSSGLVGVNTVVPQTLLMIQGRANEDPFSIASSTGGSILRVRTNGNVGIGTSTPSQKLSVVGNISNIISASTTVSEVATLSLSGSPSNIVVSGRYGYVTQYLGDSFSIVDFSNPDSPATISTVSLASGSNPRGVAISGQYAYTANQSDNTLSVIDISNPNAPFQVATTTAGTGPIDVVVSGQYAYIGNLGNEFFVIDISNPRAPRMIATTTVAAGAGPQSIAVSGKYLYTGNNLDSTISIFDISNPSSPVFVATTTVGSNPVKIQVSGRYAFTANSGASTISVIDVKNPAAPVQVATVAATGISSMFLSGRYIYALNDTDDTLMVFDVSVSTSPKKVFESSVLSGFGLNSVYVSGRYAYVVNMNAGSISVIDISGTEVSSLIAHSAEVGNLQSRNDIFAQGTILAGTSLMVGKGGLVSQGSLSVFVSSTIGATSSIFNVGSGTFADILRVFPNGKIGINSSSPFATLSVNGDVALTGLYDSNGTRGSDGQILQTNGTSVTWVSTSSLGFSTGNNNGTVVTGTAGQFAYFATDGRTISGTSSLFVTSSGNVGVGTTSPLSKLTIFGSGASNLFDVVSSSGSSLLKILTNGNVGVGTSTPSQKLSVVGNISNIIDGNTTIAEMSSTAVGDLPNSVFVSGKYAFTANINSNNISVVDVTNPSSPVQIATTSVGGQPYSIYVSGRYAYTANYASGTISIVDVSNPFTPRQVATTSVGTNPYSIYVSGRYAYVANSGSRSVSVVDVSNPASPVQIATTSVGGTPTGIFVSGRYAYVVNNASSTISVIDVANPSAPITISTTTLAGSPSPIGIYVSGRYAYTANSASNTISIIDVSNPSAPSQVGLASVGTSPISVFVSGRYAYVTDLNATFSIVDVGNPTAPARVSTITVSAGELRSVYVSGRYAYVADSSVDALSVVDISGTEVSSLIAHSAEVGNLQSRNDIFAQGNIMAGTSLTAGIGGIMSQGALSVFASSTGATSSIFNIASSQTANAFKIFANGAVSINTTTATSTLTIQASSTFNSILTIASSTGGTLVKILNNGNVGIGTSTPTQKLSVVGNISNIIDAGSPVSVVSTTGVFGTSPYDIMISGRYAYVAYSGGSMVILDVYNPSAPVSLSTSTFAGSARGIYVAGQYAYVSNATSNTLHIYNVSNPSAPVLVATTSVGSGPEAVYVSGRYAYVANLGASSISIVDVSNPYSPRQISSVSSVGGRGVIVVGKYAYSASLGSQTINVIDVSNPSSPVLVGTVNIGVSPYDIAFSDGYIFTTNYVGASMSIVNVKNPTSPTLVTSTAISSNSQSIAVSGRYAYFAGAGKFSIVDVADVSRPLVVKEIVAAGNPVSVAVSGRYAYVGNYSNSNVYIVDISGTEVSSLMAHSAEVGNLQSRNDIFAQGNIMAGTSLTVGMGGLMSQGALSVFASSTGATSSIFNIASSQSANAFKIFANGAVSINTTTATSTLTIQASSTFNSILTIASSTGGTLVKILNNGNVGIGTSTPTQKLSVVGNISNIVDANTAITLVSSTVIDPINLAANPGNVFVSGKYAYTANYGDGTMSIVDISNPSAPTLISTTSVGTAAWAIYVSGKYAYLTDITLHTMSVVDISNKRFPSKLGTVSVGNTPGSIYVSGKYAYITNSVSSSLSIVDVSNPSAPAQVSVIPVGTGPNSVYVSGRYAYTANFSSSTVSVIDVSNPSNPIVVGSGALAANSTPTEISVSDRYAYVIDNNDSVLSVFDISNPSSPTQVATTSAGVAPNKLYVSGRYAYVLGGSGTYSLNVIDISNPLVPKSAVSAVVGGVSGLYVSGRYAYTTDPAVQTLYVYDISGTEVSSLIAHSAEVGNLQSRNDIFAQGNIMAGTSLTAGIGGIMSQGALSVFASSTGATSSIFNVVSGASSSIFRVLQMGKCLLALQQSV